MLDIIVLIFLTKKIGNLAQQKGLKSGIWKLYTVLSWFAGELVGIIVGLALFGQQNLVPVILLGLAGAVGSFFILKANLEKRPDADDDINKIGVRDLYP